MSNRSLAPQEFTPVRVPKHEHGRHRDRSMPIWVGVIAGVQLLLILAALIPVLFKERPPSPNLVSSEPAAASVPRDREKVTRETPTVAKSKPRGFESTRLAPGLTLKSDQDEPPKPKDVTDIFAARFPVESRNPIDVEVFRDLAAIGIEPARLCSDETFVRRVFLDTLGTLPTADEARRFIDSHDLEKRSKLIDELLERPEFADYWAMKWCDTLRVKAEFPINLWPHAAQAYHRWIREAMKHNLPYDQFAYQLLTASGSNFRTPEVNFYRALQSKEPEDLAKIVALTFLCERTEEWPEERLAGMAQFFSKVGYKPTGEWKEEIVFFDPRRGDEANGANQPVSAVYPNGASVKIPPGVDPREVFATWLINEKNPWFARAGANRIWYWLLGRGIVDPIDDVKSENQPSNLPLLNLLADEFVSASFDTKHLIRFITNSSTYQLACIPTTDDPRAVEHFAHYQPRRLDAEVLIDGICQITNTTETYMSIIPEPFTFLPEHQRAIALPDGSITSSFLEMFGRPSRDTGLQDERNNRFTASQALHLLNSNHIRNKLRRGSGIKRIFDQSRDTWDTTNLLYLTILSRRPTESELTLGGQLCDYESGAQELAWALINSDEFIFRH